MNAITAKVLIKDFDGSVVESHDVILQEDTEKARRLAATEILKQWMEDDDKVYGYKGRTDDETGRKVHPFFIRCMDGESSDIFAQVITK